MRGDGGERSTKKKANMHVRPPAMAAACGTRQQPTAFSWRQRRRDSSWVALQLLTDRIAQHDASGLRRDEPLTPLAARMLLELAEFQPTRPFNGGAPILSQEELVATPAPSVVAAEPEAPEVPVKAAKTTCVNADIVACSSGATYKERATYYRGLVVDRACSTLTGTLMTIATLSGALVGLVETRLLTTKA